MLHFKIIHTIRLRGFIYPFQYLVKTIGMGRNKATKYTQNVHQSISLHDLSQLCRHLNCTPNDLLYWQHSDTHPLPPQHPVHNALSPPPPMDTWQKAIQKLSPEQAQEILSLIKSKSIETDN